MLTCPPYPQRVHGCGNSGKRRLSQRRFGQVNATCTRTHGSSPTLNAQRVLGTTNRQNRPNGPRLAASHPATSALLQRAESITTGNPSQLLEVGNVTDPGCRVHGEYPLHETAPSARNEKAESTQRRIKAQNRPDPSPRPSPREDTSLLRKHPHPYRRCITSWCTLHGYGERPIMVGCPTCRGLPTATGTPRRCRGGRGGGAGDRRPLHTGTPQHPVRFFVVLPVVSITRSSPKCPSRSAKPWPSSVGMQGNEAARNRCDTQLGKYGVNASRSRSGGADGEGLVGSARDTSWAQPSECRRSWTCRSRASHSVLHSSSLTG